jgi:hypothetical protein
MSLEPSEHVYSSINLPPDVETRRTFAEVARTIPAAEKLGKVWTVPASAWREARISARGGAR